jgi:hypothetical protein
VRDPTRTIAALEDILGAAAARGLSVVPVGELIAETGAVR